MEARDEDRDRGCVRRVRAGEIDAFEEIVRRWQGPLVNLAYRFCRDPGKSDEMAQEAFLRAFRKLDRWREDSRFSTWLFAVALNVYRSHLRRMRPPEVPLSSDTRSAASGDPDEQLLRNERNEVVRRAVARLPARYRDALVLYYFGELDVSDVADVLGVAEGTVKARLHRGRELLLRRLGGLPYTRRSVEAT